MYVYARAAGFSIFSWKKAVSVVLRELARSATF